MYTPFNEYDPVKKYDPFESSVELKNSINGALKKVNESRLIPPEIGHEAAASHIVTLRLDTYTALVGCEAVLEAVVRAFKEDTLDEKTRHGLNQKARHFLEHTDPEELHANMPEVARVVSAKA